LVAEDSIEHCFGCSHYSLPDSSEMWSRRWIEVPFSWLTTEMLLYSMLIEIFLVVIFLTSVPNEAKDISDGADDDL
jgi:hypothetical protein